MSPVPIECRPWLAAHATNLPRERDEIIVMVNIALGTAPVSACPRGDPGGDGQVSVDEIILAVNAVLGGCG